MLTTREQQVLDWLAASQDQMFDLLQRMVDIDSGIEVHFMRLFR